MTIPVIITTLCIIAIVLAIIGLYFSVKALFILNYKQKTRFGKK